jgi:hypothetical protein
MHNYSSYGLPFYIGSEVLNAPLVKQAVDILCAPPWSWKLTYDWSVIGKVPEPAWERTAVVEFDGVERAKVFIGILSGRKGFHTEFGIALADKKRFVYLIGAPENFKDCFPVDYPSVFYFHPRVRRIIIPSLHDKQMFEQAVTQIAQEVHERLDSNHPFDILEQERINSHLATL